MPKESLAQVTKRRSLGILFIAILVGFVGLSIAIYDKAFTDTDTLTLIAGHTGNQLILESDVKINGLIIGSVDDVGTIYAKDPATGENTEYAKVTMHIQPDKMKYIPDNVTAEILPKTLFGEQYVSLDIPAKPGAPIKNNATIQPNRSEGALEAQDVLGDLLPLLTAVKPAELNDTLDAIATALQNKGPELAHVLTNFDHYLQIMNPHTAQLVADLKKLGQVALEYNGVAPDIFATLRNLETSARTVVDKRQALDNLLTGGSMTSGVLQTFLDENEQRLISVTGQTVKIYKLLDEYSPEFSCLLKGVNKLQTLANQAIYDHKIHLSATVDYSNIGKYKQGQEPILITGVGPNCFGLPDNPQPVNAEGKFQIPDRFKCLNDGAPLTADPCGSKPGLNAQSVAGSPEENALVNTLIAGKLHTTPDKVSPTATLLAGPLLRGHRVVVK